MEGQVISPYRRPGRASGSRWIANRSHCAQELPGVRQNMQRQLYAREYARGPLTLALLLTLRLFRVVGGE